jgi:hypothetical protein
MTLNNQAKNIHDIADILASVQSIHDIKDLFRTDKELFK